MPGPGLKFVVDVVNSQKMVDLTHEMGVQADAVKKLNEQLKANIITQQQFQAAAAPIGQQMHLVNQQMTELKASAGNAGRGLSQLSYAVDDIQYGFNAIVNNIPQIVLGLGGSAEIAGAVGIAAVAINQLVKNLGDLTAAFQAAWSGDTAEHLKLIAERAEQAATAFDKLIGSATKAQEFQATGIAGKITGGPSAEIFKGVAEAIAQDPTLKAERVVAAASGPTIGAPGVIPTPQKTRAQREEEAELLAAAKDRETAKQLLGAATKGGPEGDAARLNLARLARQHPGNFPPEFAQDIENQSPKRQEEIKQQRLEAQGERNARKLQEKMDEETKKRIDLLNKEGPENERRGLEKQKQERISDLQDKREAIQEQLKADLDRLPNARPSQIIQGAKASLDLYQMSSSGSKDEAAQKLRADANKLLKSIDDSLKKERRLVIEH